MEEEFVTYMRNIAINCKDISHTTNQKRFYHIRSIFEAAEIIDKIRNLTGDIIMLAESPEGNITENNADNPFETKRAAFILLIKAKPSDLNEEKIHYDVMATAKKIIARMKRDRMNNVIHHFKVDIDYQKVGPFANDRYGYRFEFEWGKATNSLIYDSNDWHA